MSIFTVKRQGPGRLSLVRRPSAREPSAMVDRWKAEGFSLIVCLLEPAEAHELGLGEEAALCDAAGLEFVGFPITDRGLPESMTATLALVDRMAGHLAGGGSVGVHCRASIGRSGLLAASLLVREGESAGKAFARISQARGLQCPDTAEQIAWVERFQAYLADLPPNPFKAVAPVSAAPR